jgi:hypothetical protein
MASLPERSNFHAGRIEMDKSGIANEYTAMSTSERLKA